MPSTVPSSVSKGDLHPEHPRRHKRRTPDEFNGIQVNYCKNPQCSNFGVPTGKRMATGTNAYQIVASAKGFPQGRCNGCGEHFPLSNQGISEELSRMMKALEPAEPAPSCPDTSCRNHGTEETAGGKTSAARAGLLGISSRSQPQRQRLPVGIYAPAFAEWLCPL